MNQEQLLASIGRQGWKVRSNVPETRRVQKLDNKGMPVEGEFEYQPTGIFKWVVVSPDGTASDNIFVRVVTDPNSQNKGGVGYELADAPSNVPVAAGAKAPTAGEQNEAELNNERWWNANNTRWGRVTHAERAALEARERAEGRQLSMDEQAAVLAQSREERAVRAEERAVSADERAAAAAERNAQNQANQTQIARERLALDAANNVKIVDTAEGKQMVRINTDGTLTTLHTFPAGIDVRTTQDGTILAVDPANPTAPQVIWQPQRPPEFVEAPQGQRTLVQRDQQTGELSGVPNPAYQNPALQRFNELFDSVTNLEGMLARGEIDTPTANRYKDLLKQNFDASLRGTTPYQEYQDRQQRTMRRMESAQSMLNQRVAQGSGLAQSLLGSAVGLGQGIMDSGAFAGFAPFAGAEEFVTRLGGGQGVYDQAASAIQAGMSGEGGVPDVATPLLEAALNPSAPATAGGGGGASPVSAAIGAALAPQTSNAMGPTAPDDPYGRTDAITVSSPSVQALLQAVLNQPRNAMGRTAIDDPYGRMR